MLSNSSKGEWSLFHTTSVSSLSICYCAGSCFAGLISQVADDLWEVKNKQVTNLTREDITIVDYKKSLAKRSELTQILIDSGR